MPAEGSTSETRHHTEKVIEPLLTHFQNLKQKDPQRSFDETQRKIIYRKFNGICQMCGKLCEWGDYEADHIIPWNRGGQTCIENGQVLCASCNSKKHDNL